MNCEYKKYSLSESTKRMDAAIQNIRTVICKSSSILSSDCGEEASYQTAYVYAAVMSIVIHSDNEWDTEEGELELALGYKTIFQETIMLLRDSKICKSYYVDGMHIIAVFDTPKKNDIKSLVDLAARISSLIDIWRYKRGRNKCCSFRCSIGIHYDRVLKFDEEKMNHSGDRSIYLGMAMRKANLMSYQPVSDRQISCIRISSVAFQNLSLDYQRMFRWEVKYDSYQSSLHNVEMKKWLKEQEVSG